MNCAFLGVMAANAVAVVKSVCVGTVLTICNVAGYASAAVTTVFVKAPAALCVAAAPASVDQVLRWIGLAAILCAAILGVPGIYDAASSCYAQTTNNYGTWTPTSTVDMSTFLTALDVYGLMAAALSIMATIFKNNFLLLCGVSLGISALVMMFRVFRAR